MLTFTYKDDDKYYKMDIINDIKNYITKQLRNNNIKYYSNIELGNNFDNPHLHIQLFYNMSPTMMSETIEKIKHIRDNVIAKYGLFSEYCMIALPKFDIVRYDYVVKDYKIKNDSELLLLDDMKRDYRLNLHKNIRFSSFSKEKYSKKIYKLAYSRGILKGSVDELIDDKVINESIDIIDDTLIYYFKMLVLSFLVQYRTSNIISYSHIIHYVNKYNYTYKLIVLRAYTYF